MTNHRANTKQAALIAMLRAPEGATLDEIVAALGWQKHTARGAMSGALKKAILYFTYPRPSGSLKL
ncbi:DUF3489 domain-containing protein [Pseudorhodobacter sp.]|uniref:DUF3489 domain-containing protein n=1 Tax=Pseudorhodobacter sp. TaxID=1934400 RepID=UPI003A4C80DA